jgi:hypothetical protein
MAAERHPAATKNTPTPGWKKLQLNPLNIQAATGRIIVTIHIATRRRGVGEGAKCIVSPAENELTFCDELAT